MKEINEMNKKELVELATNLMNEIQELKTSLDNKDAMIAELQLKLESSSKDGRKSQVLELLKKYPSISILEIANKLNISTKNVSSQLTYLRQDGYAIFTDPNGRKLLIEKKKVESSSVDESSSVNEDKPQSETK